MIKTKSIFNWAFDISNTFLVREEFPTCVRDCVELRRRTP